MIHLAAPACILHIESVLDATIVQVSLGQDKQLHLQIVHYKH